jgi:hypothetical protein
VSVRRDAMSLLRSSLLIRMQRRAEHRSSHVRLACCYDFPYGIKAGPCGRPPSAAVLRRHAVHPVGRTGQTC